MRQVATCAGTANPSARRRRRGNRTRTSIRRRPAPGAFPSARDRASGSGRRRGRDRWSNDPFPVYAHYQKHDPVHWGMPQAPGGDGCWYVFGYHDVVSVLKDSRFLRKWPPGASAAAIARAPSAQQPFLTLADNLLLSKDPPDHQRLRGLVTRAFSHAAMEAHRDSVQSLADALIRRLNDRTGFDLVD